MKAMFINRLGDIGLVLGLIHLIEAFGGLEFSTVVGGLSHPCSLNKEGLNLICLFLF